MNQFQYTQERSPSNSNKGNPFCAFPNLKFEHTGSKYGHILWKRLGGDVDNLLKRHFYVITTSRVQATCENKK